jgi:hypothetical protein
MAEKHEGKQSKCGTMACVRERPRGVPCLPCNNPLLQKPQEQEHNPIRKALIPLKSPNTSQNHHFRNQISIGVLVETNHIQIIANQYNNCFP